MFSWNVLRKVEICGRLVLQNLCEMTPVCQTLLEITRNMSVRLNRCEPLETFAFVIVFAQEVSSYYVFSTQFSPEFWNISVSVSEHDLLVAS